MHSFSYLSGDAHQSEYVCESDARRQFISGFTGSAGTAVILKDKALLWTDGRYVLLYCKKAKKPLLSFVQQTAIENNRKY